MATPIAQISQLIKNANDILLLQPENPDGDSMGSALALEHILGDLGKTTHLLCMSDIPKYLRFLPGWDRIQKELPKQLDLTILVDAGAKTLLERTLKAFGTQLSKKPFVIIDHHDATPDIDFEGPRLVDAKAVAAGQVVFELAEQLKWKLNKDACYLLGCAIISDSGNFVFEKTNSKTLRTVAELMDRGLNLRQLHLDRREQNIIPAKVLRYKAELLSRIEYSHQGAIATVSIPWDEIEEYSDFYNPSELVIGEMLMVEGVQLAASFKHYPARDMITAKLRANAPIAAEVGEAFGGGGHHFAAGCKVNGQTLASFKSGFLTKAAQIIDNYTNTHAETS